MNLNFEGSAEDRSLERLRADHTPEAIRKRLRAGPEHSYLRDSIYGAIDGAVTTFAVVAGVTGASLSSGIVVVLGVASVVADGFSMAVSNFLGTRAEEQLRDRARRSEEMQINAFPEGEREEIRQIFAEKGLAGDDLERVVEVITSDQKRWVDTMLREELGTALHGPMPWKAAWTTFWSFLIAGALPLLPYGARFAIPEFGFDPFSWSAALTAVAFFAVGALKSRFVEQNWLMAGAETTLLGGAAAVLAYVSGFLLKGFAGLA